MPRRIAVLAGLAGAAALAAWIAVARPEAPARTAPAPGAAAARPAPSTGALARPEAPPSGAAAAANPAGDDAAALRAALLEADASIASDTDVLDAERLLSRALIRRPDLAGAAAEALGRLRERRLAFAVARLLGRSLGDPRVRAAILDLVRDGEEGPREAAAYALRGVRGDPEAAAALAAGFEDERAPDALRAAHAFALAPMLDDLPAGARERAREAARVLLAEGRGGAALRAEAVDLLDVRGADRERARALLRGPDRTVAIAAGRALLLAGEPESDVVPLLRRLAPEAAFPEGGR
jgi:hypothetical protein